MDFVDPPIKFAALAQALGVRSHRIETPDAFRAAYIDAVAAREPVFIEIMVEGGVWSNVRLSGHHLNREKRQGQGPGASMRVVHPGHSGR